MCKNTKNNNAAAIKTAAQAEQMTI